MEENDMYPEPQGGDNEGLTIVVFAVFMVFIAIMLFVYFSRFPT